MPEYIVTYTSMVIEADSPEDAILRAEQSSGGHWEAVERKAVAKPVDFALAKYPQTNFEIESDPDVATITAKNGIRFNVRILRPGQAYGATNSLVWTPHEMIGGCGVEFYDTRYPHTEFGQFTGGRYYVSTILSNKGNGDSESAWGGLCLDGGVPDWQIDAEAMFVVRQWLHERTGEVG